MSSSLLIELGNVEPFETVDGVTRSIPGPVVTRFTVTPNKNEDGSFHPGYMVGSDVAEIRRQITMHPGPVKHFGGNELIHDVIGQWETHSLHEPVWVSVIDPGPYPVEVMEDFERFLAEYWDIPQGRPDDLEEMYFTQYGAQVFAPGKKPE